MSEDKQELEQHMIENNSSQEPLVYLFPHIEAVLFAAAVPLQEEVLAQILEITEVEVRRLLTQYMEHLKERRSGLTLRITGAGVELITSPDSSHYVRKIREKEEKLSKAGMETLAIIAFKQPVTKAEIEEIRGVNCEKVLKQLVQRQMISELGRKETIGRPVLYGTTEEFLRLVGAKSVEELTVEIQ